MAMTVKVSGAMKSVPYPQVKASGTWKHVQNIFTKVSGAWKPIYAYWFDVGGWGGCSASCGGGTQTRTVQCKRTGGIACSDDFCTRAGLAVPARSQSCNTQGCTTCTGTADGNTYYGFGACGSASSGRYCDTSCYNKKTIGYENGSIIYSNYNSVVWSFSANGYTYTPGSFLRLRQPNNVYYCAHQLCKTPN